MLEANRIQILGRSIMLAPGAYESLTWELPADTPGLFTPRRLFITEKPNICCECALTVAGRRVRNVLVRRPGDEYMEPPLMPSCHAGDTVVVDVQNPGAESVEVGVGVEFHPESERYVRLEQQTPRLEPGAAGVVMFYPQIHALPVRLEFETDEEWAPEGWLLESFVVGDVNQLMANIGVPTEMLSGACCGAKFSTLRSGHRLSATVRRCAGYPAGELTVRVVLDPASAMPTRRVLRRAPLRSLPPEPPIGDDDDGAA